MNGKRRNASFRTRAGRIIDSRRRGSIRWLFPSVTGCNRWKKARGGRGKRGERLVSGRIRGKGKPEGGGIRCSALENKDALLPRESHFLASTPLVYLASFIISTARLLPSSPSPLFTIVPTNSSAESPRFQTLPPSSPSKISSLDFVLSRRISIEEER